MSYTYSQVLRLYLSSLCLVTGGILAVFLADIINLPFLYGVLAVSFFVGALFQTAVIFTQENKIIAVVWFGVALLTFFGDVISTVVAVNFDYALFVELEANLILVIGINEEHVLASGAAMAFIKLFAHLWIFSSPAVWTVMKTKDSIIPSDLAGITFGEHFTYTRFRLYSDSWDALCGKQVEGHRELHFLTFMESRWLVYSWGALFILVTISNFLVYGSIILESELLQMIHRILFVFIVTTFLVGDIVGFFFCRRYARKKIAESV